uniref:Cell division control protein 1 n=2 Tax=Cacopsylla melanoneura TaxID=428564 RepID=A0A8D9EPM6_9HEMI
MMKILSTRIPPLRKITKLGKNYLKIGFKYVDNNMCSSILRSAFQQKFKIFLYFGLFLFVYCEWLSYALCPRYWPSLSFTSLTPSQKFFKVLVVADPQILGDRNEKPFSRWDNDRYLSKTFSKALSYTSPDLVVFLGDIMDEGHIAHDEHFNKYLARVRQIFQLDKLAPHQVLFLPGDNDVGGEEDEVSLNKLNRFNNHFNVSYFSVHGGIQFVTVNKLTRTYPSMAGHPNNTMRIVISHLPLLNRASDFGYEIISQLHPSLVVSAHEHTSTHIVWNTQEDPSHSRSRVEEYAYNEYTGQSLWRLSTNQKGVVQEVTVPTCSYRMGVPRMAYGFMYIDKEHSLINYGLLWLPSRLFHLFLYIAYLVTAAFILLVKYKTSPSDILNVRKYYHNV